MAMARGKGSDPKGGEPGSGPVTSSTPAPSLEDMGYEEARAALADVVAALESGDVTLEEALALWERGEEYARICEVWLAGAQERLSREDPASPAE